MKDEEIRMNNTSEEQALPAEQPSQEALHQKSTALSAERQKALAEISTDDKGSMVAKTFEAKFRLARVYHASGCMPKGLNSPEKILVALEICSELGLPPMTSISKIAIINQTPSLWGELPLALVRRSGVLQSIKETWIHDDKGSVTGATCVLVRKGEAPVKRTFTIEMAKKAGLWGKEGPWSKYPDRMLQMRARGWSIKDSCPDVLLGICQAEYDFNAVVHADGRIEGAIDGSSAAAGINHKYLGEQVEKN